MAAAQAASPAPACLALERDASWSDCAGGADLNGTPMPAGVERPVADGAAEAAPRATALVSSIPEPHTLALMAAGLCAMGFLARRRRLG